MPEPLRSFNEFRVFAECEQVGREFLDLDSKRLECSITTMPLNAILLSQGRWRCRVSTRPPPDTIELTILHSYRRAWRTSFNSFVESNRHRKY